LEVYANGSALFYFNDTPNVPGGGHESIIGWECIGVGQGYWWRIVPGQNVVWCNLFQLTVNEVGGTEMVNLAYGIAGVEATGLCPRNFSTAEELQLVQATLVKVSSGDGENDDGSGGAVTCTIPASEGQPSCRSRFDREAPNPFVNRSSVDEIFPPRDPSTCVAEASDSYRQQINCRVAALIGMTLLLWVLVNL